MLMPAAHSAGVAAPFGRALDTAIATLVLVSSGEISVAAHVASGLAQLRRQQVAERPALPAATPGRTVDPAPARRTVIL